MDLKVNKKMNHRTKGKHGKIKGGQNKIIKRCGVKVK